MNADRLLAHFEQISEASDAIARLRRFILDLAVRGKLVEQDPEDEPAGELLAAISLETQQVKGSRKASPRSAGLVLDGPFGVPTSWEWTQLGAIGNWGSGSTPSRGRSDYYGGAISWFKSGELNDNKCLRESDEKITHLALEQCSFRLNSPGDVLIAMYGATIGKLAILGEEAVTNQAVCACTPCWGVDTEYLYLFLLAQRDEFRLASEGGAQPNISKVKIVNTLIPLPPLAEQHRIVAKVDELMALCDQLEAARQQREQGRERLVAATLQRLNQPAEDPATFRKDASFALQVLPSLTNTPAQIKQLRQTILNLAVRGKLVEQDPEDEPVEVLLRKISQDLAAFTLQRRSRSQAKLVLTAEEHPFPLPCGWRWVSLDELFRVITDGDHQPPPKASDGVSFLTIGNISGGTIDFNGCRFVRKEYFDSLDEIRRPGLGDILYTVVGASYGRPVIVATERPFCVQRHIAILKPSRLMNSGYLLQLLSSPFVYSQATASLTGTAQPTIPLRPLRNFLAPLPPLAEQHRIVAKVDELMALCDQLEQQLSQADQQRRRLLEAVLAEALGGRLLIEKQESHAAIA